MTTGARSTRVRRCEAKLASAGVKQCRPDIAAAQHLLADVAAAHRRRRLPPQAQAERSCAKSNNKYGRNGARRQRRKRSRNAAQIALGDRAHDEGNGRSGAEQGASVRDRTRASCGRKICRRCSIDPEPRIRARARRHSRCCRNYRTARKHAGNGQGQSVARAEGRRARRWKKIGEP